MQTFDQSVPFLAKGNEGYLAVGTWDMMACHGAFDDRQLNVF